MAYTRKQVVTCISIIYLIFVVALSGYAFSRTRRLSIPISSTLAGFTTALPIVSGALLEAGYDLTRREERRQHLPKGGYVRSPFVIAAHALIFIFSTVIMTLLGTHAAPASALECGLQARWSQLFSRRDSEAVRTIRTIQNAFECCGFRTTHDRAWPFPDKSHDARACESAFGRTTACLGPWRQEEQRLAGVLMVVVGLVFLWQISIIAVPTRRDTWLHQVLPDRISRIVADEESQGPSRSRRAIDYLPNRHRYRDNVADDESGEESGQRAIETGVEQVNPIVENEWAARN